MRIVTLRAGLVTQIIMMFTLEQVILIVTGEADILRLNAQHFWILATVMMMTEQTIIDRYGTMHESCFPRNIPVA